VPRGTIQLETGYEYTRDNNNINRIKQSSYPTTLIRIGILKKAELRINADFQQEITEMFGDNSTISKQTGLNNIQLGTKINFLEGQGVVPGIGFLGNITLPAGNIEFRPPHVAPAAWLLFNNKISDKVELQYNAGYRKRQEQEEYQGEAIYTVTGSVKMTDNLQWSVEFAGLKAKGAAAENLLNTAFLLRVLPNLQLDAIGGLGLNKSSPDLYAGGGVTWRVPR
jgi:hypothetical protein